MRALLPALGGEGGGTWIILVYVVLIGAMMYFMIIKLVIN